MVSLRSNLVATARSARFLFALCCLLGAQPLIQAAEPAALLSAWFESQGKIQTWTADFVQTRTLKSFAQPLTATGQVWFASPNSFRWELGNPPQTIAVRKDDEMLVIYPKLKRVEKYPLGGDAAGQWKDTLSLLEAGFPRDRQEMETRFNIQTVKLAGESCEVIFQPKSASARKMMPQIRIWFSTRDYALLATELAFADGSTMKNDFKNPKLNEKLDEKLFSPEIAANYKITEPLKPRR